MNIFTNIAIGIVIASVAGIGGFSKGYLSGKEKVQQQWDQEKTKQYAEYAKAQDEARQREQEMQAAADKLRKDKNAEIRDINARHTGILNSLRDRPDRATTDTSAMSGAANACAGSTGAELARGNAEFLAEYATDAAKLEAAFDQCVTQYDEVRKKFIK
jgi:hypothetical protein